LQTLIAWQLRKGLRGGLSYHRQKTTLHGTYEKKKKSVNRAEVQAESRKRGENGRPHGGGGFPELPRREGGEGVTMGGEREKSTGSGMDAYGLEPRKERNVRGGEARVDTGKKSMRKGRKRRQVQV